jgi:hypothetical protein
MRASPTAQISERALLKATFFLDPRFSPGCCKSFWPDHKLAKREREGLSHSIALAREPDFAQPPSFKIFNLHPLLPAAIMEGRECISSRRVNGLSASQS